MNRTPNRCGCPTTRYSGTVHHSRCTAQTPSPAVRYCATCGEREGSEYAKHCCQIDNLLEDTEPTTKETLS